MHLVMCSVVSLKVVNSWDFLGKVGQSRGIMGLNSVNFRFNLANACFNLASSRLRLAKSRLKFANSRLKLANTPVLVSRSRLRE